MLILTRRPRQRIIIDRRIEVTVLQVQGDSVRLGISAPPQIEVHRQEVLAAVMAENRSAVTPKERLGPGNAALQQWQREFGKGGRHDGSP